MTTRERKRQRRAIRRAFGYPLQRARRIGLPKAAVDFIAHPETARRFFVLAHDMVRDVYWVAR